MRAAYLFPLKIGPKITNAFETNNAGRNSLFPQRKTLPIDHKGRWAGCYSEPLVKAASTISVSFWSS
jgi:hypothetical protein